MDCVICGKPGKNHYYYETCGDIECALTLLKQRMEQEEK